MIKKNIVLLCLFFISTFNLLAFQPKSNKASFNFPTLLEIIQKSNAKSNVNPTDVMKWLLTQQADGSWPDIVYGKMPHDVKLNNKHFERILNLVQICTDDKLESYNSPTYRKAIKTGLDYWFISNTIHWNWWFTYIDYPKKVGIIIALMRKLPDNDLDEKKLMSLLVPTKIEDITSHGGGANMLDIAIHYVYRGILTRDTSLLINTIKKISDSLVTNIYSDLVYLDHGPQLYIHGYGTAFISAVLKIAEILNNTPAAFNSQEGNFLTFLQFVRNTWIPSIKGQYWDFNVMGRSLGNKDALKAKGTASMVQQLIAIDPEYEEFYKDAYKRITGEKLANYNSPTFNKYYWNADYTQHLKKDYYFSVRAVSKRTVEAESGNGANLKANYFSFGNHCIMVEGDEYAGIMPVWDWSMIPGVTYKHTDYFNPKRKGWGVNFGLTDFVGAVSDSSIGVYAYDFKHSSIVAKKSYFMFEKEIVALGASISDTSNLPVYTTINQCLADKYEKVFYSVKKDKEEEIKNDNEYFIEDIKYVRHGEVAYFFPYNQNINIRIGTQSGTLESIGNGSKDIITLPVFKLWINHGKAPINKSYAYIVAPNIRSEKEARKYNSNSIQIINNTNLQQVVYQKDLDVYGAIFYEAGNFTNESISIKVNKPCIILFKNNKTIFIADPTKTLDSVEVSIKIDGKEKTENVLFSDIKGATKTYSFF